MGLQQMHYNASASTRNLAHVPPSCHIQLFCGAQFLRPRRRELNQRAVDCLRDATVLIFVLGQCYAFQADSAMAVLEGTDPVC